MALCKFYQQGNCKFGSTCRFEHPGASNNRFGALGGGGGGGGNSVGNTPRGLEKYNIKLDAIEADLTTETPQWILSAYAPGRDAPEQLFGGYPREQSFEELRWHFLQAKAQGNEQKALAEVQELYQNAQQQMQTAVRNTSEAARFILEAETKHPNRLDICHQGTQGAPFGEFLVGKRPKSIAPGAEQASNPFASNNTASPFGGSANTNTPASGFGQPSQLGQKPNPFGTPAFGQPAQPAQPAQAAASPFGAPQPAAASPFGQPAQSTPVFGQPSQPTSAFGQPSALGAKPNPFGTPAFGQPSQPAAQSSAFGQPSQLGQTPNPFGSNTTSNTSASPFASAGNSATPANPFGGGNSNQGSAPANPFGSNSNTQQNASPFGKPEQPTATINPQNDSNPPSSNPVGGFGQPSSGNPFASQPSQQTNGQPNPFASGGGSTPAANPFASTPAQPAKPAPPPGNPYAPDSGKQHPPLDSYASKNMDGSLAAFKGKPVSYKDGKPGIRGFDGTWTKIWFPNGPPGFYKDTELPANQYDEKAKSQWMSFAQTGSFSDGLMPDVPPPRECTQWDF